MILRALKAALVWMFGDENGITVGDFCALCDDVHETGTLCHRALLGVCVECNAFRQLDRFGNGAACGHRSIVKRQLLYPSVRRPSSRHNEAHTA